MTKQGSPPSFRDRLVDEIIDEIDGLEEDELDAFLRDMDQDPDAVLKTGEAVRKSSIAEARLARLRGAQQELKANKKLNTATLLSFDLDRKRQIFDVVKQRSEATGEMTLAARNQRIDSDKDLDSFLEACLRLGLINEAGDIVD
ncbi:MAG: hypothetical protein EON58_04865 [Alphaproteobacteria bacterium]|nr:MAG: hypothetical protein EON58_04865 [Alphaproteobacteria bacterium]